MHQIDRYLASLTEEGRYRLLIEAVTDYAIYLLDPSGVVATWNPGARRFKGYAANEIIGQHFSRFYTEDDKKIGLPARALETAKLEGKFEAEGWRVRKDGSRFWAYVVIDPIRDHSGQVIGFAKITRDLTERKAAEQVLHRSEEQFRLLVQGVSDYAIYLLDLDGNITNWNLGAQRIKGYFANEIIGQHFSRFYTDGTAQQVFHKRHWRPSGKRDGSKKRLGAFARTDHGFGLMSSSMPFAMTKGTLSAMPRSPATSPSARKPRKNSKKRGSSLSRRRSSRRLVSSQAESPMILTTC
jgi:PAS domain S-box-containing protein